jgi:GxxExxY protein
MPASTPPSRKEIIAHIDGASRGNPGPAAYGVIVETSAGEHLASISAMIGTATNNAAEYRGLLAALDYALENQYSHLKVLTDSELLARQIEGTYRVRHPDLKPLHEAAREKIGRLQTFAIRHVPREENREADRLCNQTLDGKLQHKDPKAQRNQGSNDAEPSALPSQTSQNPIPAELEQIAQKVVDAAYRVHSTLGPGLIESVYETCLLYELNKRGLNVRQQVELPIEYDGIRINAGLRLDLLVEESLVVELKAIDGLLPVHTFQLLTYLKLSGLRLGLLINFNVPLIRDGIKRVVL